MANAGVQETIYVTLDALMDTRIGTVARINEEAAAKALLGNYHQRQIDDFEGIDRQEYLDLYRQRDKVTLASSRPTGFLMSLREIVKQISEQGAVRPFHDGAHVVVNTYPYELEEEEISELGKAIAFWMGSYAAVELIHVPDEQLTPEYCKSRFSMMVMYEYEHWMNAQAEAFKRCRLPQVLLLAPAIYFNRVPTQEELDKEMKESMHPLKAMELLASPIVELRLMDVVLFSIVA